jgi:hypothetical protein
LESVLHKTGRRFARIGKRPKVDGNSEKFWRGSPLELEDGIDPYSVEEVVIRFDTEEEEILRPKLRQEFESYEFHQTAAYLGALTHVLRGG